MSTLDLFLPITKVDLDKRIVYGLATAEVADRAGEICDYASTKPYFEEWSANALAASGGKSLGAVRSMHGRIAAGKLTDIAFDDAGKRIRVAAKIVDDDEWLKVSEGVYTGFSQGGRYVKRWPDAVSGLTRYTAEPTEISLVDLPCLPGATFDVVKGDSVETRPFASGSAGAAAGGLARADANEAPPLPQPAPNDADKATADAPASAPMPEPPIVKAETRSVSERPATAPAADPASGEALAKAASDLSMAAHKLSAAREESDALRKLLAELPRALAALSARVAAIETQPMPAKAALRAIAKSADGDGGASVDQAVRRLADLPPAERARALMKLSLANPIPPRF